METSVADTQDNHPKRPFNFEVESAAFGLRERERVRRLLLRRKVEGWIGTIVVMVLVGCAIFALVNTRVTFSDNPNIQGFRSKK